MFLLIKVFFNQQKKENETKKKKKKAASNESPTAIAGFLGYVIHEWYSLFTQVPMTYLIEWDCTYVE